MVDINPQEYINTITFKVNTGLLSSKQLTKHELEVEIAMHERLAQIGYRALWAKQYTDEPKDFKGFYLR